MTSLTEEEARLFFAEFYRGEHHFPEELKKYGPGWAITDCNSLSTFDFDGLTRLVLMAHEQCIRVEVSPASPNRIRIAIWKREREGDTYQRHPTIEQAIESFRRAEA